MMELLPEGEKSVCLKKRDFKNSSFSSFKYETSVLVKKFSPDPSQKSN